MLNERLEFELEYDPITRKLTFIDYKMNKLKNPFRMIYANIETAEQIANTVKAWIKLKETQNPT